MVFLVLGEWLIKISHVNNVKAKKKTLSTTSILPIEQAGDTIMYVLSELFGGCPQVKIVETFTEHYEDALSVPEIERMTDVSKATVYSHTKKLLEEGVVKKVGKVGKTQLYQLNVENTKAKIILMLERYIVSERLENLIKKERIIEEPVAITELAGDPCNIAPAPLVNTPLNTFWGTKNPPIPSWDIGATVVGGEAVAMALADEQTYYMENVNG